MSNPYSATPEHWAAMEYEATMELASRACILELRARVEELEADALEQSRSQEFCLDHIIRRLEKLEKRCDVQLVQLSGLQEQHHRLVMEIRHLEAEVYVDDKPQQHCVEALEAPTLLERAMKGDAAAAKQFLYEAGFTDKQGYFLPQYQPRDNPHD